MAKEYTMQMPSHNSIYTEHFGDDNYNKRKVRVDYCLPDHGVNEETGILLFIAGFGASIDSNVYIKMRRLFADNYNLVTIQCEYFGSKYMQSINELSKQDHILNSLKEGSREIRLRLDETTEDFNDMSIMQAIDNINAVINVTGLLCNSGARYNTDKVIIYGNSHGSYLGYLCNRLAPGLFNLIIDNSAWITPVYLDYGRGLFFNIAGYGAVNITFEYYIYYARHLRLHDDLYSLKYLYRDFDNKCMIISCHGVKDSLVSIQEKRELLENVSNMMLIEIEESDVDGKLFKTAEHGLEADFLELFDIIYSEYGSNIPSIFEPESPRNVSLDNGNNKLILSYDNILPEVYFV